MLKKTLIVLTLPLLSLLDYSRFAMSKRSRIIAHDRTTTELVQLQRLRLARFKR